MTGKHECYGHGIEALMDHMREGAHDRGGASRRVYLALGGGAAAIALSLSSRVWSSM